MLLVWDSYGGEFDRMAENEFAAAQAKNPMRYVLIGEDVED